MVYLGLMATGLILLVWYYIVLGQAERPKAGTLEWIDRYERPCFTLDSCGKELCCKDALWAWGLAFLSVVVSLLLSAGSAYDGSLGLLLRFKCGGPMLYLSAEMLCAAIAAAAAYLLGKALTGSVFAALAGAVLFAVRPTDALFSCLLLCGLLCLWLWAGYPRRGFANWALLLAGALLSGAAAFSFYLCAVTLAFLISLAVVLCYRVRNEVFGGWYALLLFASAFVLAAVGFLAGAALHGKVSPFSAKFLPGVGAALIARWKLLYAALCTAEIGARLPAVLLLSGLVPLVTLFRSRRTGDALFLLLWALPIALQYALIPNVFPSASAALVCAYLTGRLLERGHPAAARLGAIGAIAVVALQGILWEVFSPAFYF
ncbi:MAG: hypothetical protein IJ980_06315 [Oscillospiraceae bacterium]|nr:hypothetical protein [Oscillospiraceae bacterium]